MPVIVDTSVWIDFLGGDLVPRYAKALDRLIEDDEAVVTDVIRYEILVGAANEAEYEKLKKLLSALNQIDFDPHEFEEFTMFSLHLRRVGALGGFADCQIAYQANKRGHRLFTLDRYFRKLHDKHIIRLFEA